MQSRAILGTDRTLSILTLGCNVLGHIPGEDAAALVHTALDREITAFDTAASYADGRSEEELGRILRKRSDLLIATKIGHPASFPPEVPRLSEPAIEQAIDASRRRLCRDTVDLCLLHFPDPLTPVEATLHALAKQIAAGTIRSYGCRTFPHRGSQS